ncbi:hypothetical protein FHS31_000719 [Sphingomonas vulcanisoli]|uniref:Uncharacterized protein n=1 Tax=Sphingomonas vulcanisoli TaxID=1658060 RepID=A0ABX0TRY9_9SPHN|nr:hypothetical protein [Sphingomonas vulcanisoli]NIJ07137.1 hypothetical protein [Sphingomonas vulcanisoli]
MRFLLRLAAIASLPLIAPAACHDAFVAVAAPVSDRISVTTVGNGPDVILIDSLHFIMIDQPDAFLKEVDTFLG